MPELNIHSNVSCFSCRKIVLDTLNKVWSLVTNEDSTLTSACKYMVYFCIKINSLFPVLLRLVGVTPAQIQLQKANQSPPQSTQ